MSYDVWLTIDTGGDEPGCVADCGNMTSNVGPVWRHVGADVAEFHGKLAGDCLPALVEGLRQLDAAPRAFDHLVRGGGEWGTVESAIEYLTQLEKDFRAHPKATVRVSR
jgi:hypothetical protein